MKYHIVYLAFEDAPNGRNYIGKHSTDNLNDGYLGSYQDKTFTPSDRIVLGYYKTAKEAIRAEIQWQKVFGVVEDPSFANRSYQTSQGFDTTGLKYCLGYKRVSPPRSPEIRLGISRRMRENNPMKNTEVARKVVSNRRSYNGGENPNAKLSAGLKEIGRLLRPHFKKKVVASLLGVSEATIKRIKWQKS